MVQQQTVLLQFRNLLQQQTQFRKPCFSCGNKFYHPNILFFREYFKEACDCLKRAKCLMQPFDRSAINSGMQGLLSSQVDNSFSRRNRRFDTAFSDEVVSKVVPRGWRHTLAMVAHEEEAARRPTHHLSPHRQSRHAGDRSCNTWNTVRSIRYTFGVPVTCAACAPFAMDGQSGPRVPRPA